MQATGVRTNRTTVSKQNRCSLKPVEVALLVVLEEVVDVLDALVAVVVTV